MRQAANLAIDRKGMNQALSLGYCKITGSIIPDTFEFYWQPPAAGLRSGQGEEAAGRGRLSQRLRCRRLSTATRPTRTSARRRSTISRQIGIRAKLRPLERAGVLQGLRREEVQEASSRAASGAFGNAATRLEAFVVKGGAYVYGSYPDIDELFQQQAVELDRKKRAAILHKMQQLVHEKAIYAPIWQLAFINGVGPRVGESGVRPDHGFAYTAPYEDITLERAHNQRCSS